MDIIHQKITLDVNRSENLPVLYAHQGDIQTRFVDVTLTMSGEEITLTSDYTVTIKASNNGITKAINECTVDIEQNIVVVELTDTMLDTAGVLNCEITVIDGNQLVTSQLFKINIAMSTVADNSQIQKSEEYTLLTKLIQEVYDVLNVITNGNEVYY